MVAVVVAKVVVAGGKGGEGGWMVEQRKEGE